MTRVLGLISGTSVDAVDVAAAELTLDGEHLHLRRLGEAEAPLEPDLRRSVLDALPPAATSAAALCRLDTRLGQAFAAAAVDGIERLAGGDVDVVASHGQTLYHDVVDGAARGTLQLGQPAFIAEATGRAVVADLRPRDIAAGGQGAPLVPVLDRLLLGEVDTPQAALNLGGIANATVVAPDGGLLAFDCGPANALLDLAVRRATDGGEHHDAGGRLAAAGRVDADLLAVLLEDPFLRRPPPKSTGKEHYHRGYLEQALVRAPVPALEDLLATLVAAAARAVCDDLGRLGVTRVWASGGGVHNAALMARLGEGLQERGATLDTTAALGLPIDAKEAYAVALLGWLTWHGLAGNVPAATGAAGARVLGSVTPGAGPWPGPRLPGPPRRMTVSDSDEEQR